MDHEVFISYHRDSSAELVENIVQALESKGIKCWYAPRDVVSKYAGDIVKAIEDCKIFLLIMNKYLPILSMCSTKLIMPLTGSTKRRLSGCFRSAQTKMSCRMM